MSLKFLFLLPLVTSSVFAAKKPMSLVGNPLAHARPCRDNEDVLAAFESGLPPEEENQYSLGFPINLRKFSRATIKFDSDATVTMSDPNVARISTSLGKFDIIYYNDVKSFSIHIKGPPNGTMPYATSIYINGAEYCEDPVIGFFDNLLTGYQNTAEISLSVPESGCGRRKVVYTELIVSGSPTKAGDWPWHVAIFRRDGAVVRYICGGTLLSKTLVLTAAHCATIRKNPVLPEVLSVTLGKYNLIGGDVAPQEREVLQIIVNENYEPVGLHNDIALLKLKSEAEFTDYVQPACLWTTNAYKKLPHGQIYGAVVGWGFDISDGLSPKLQQAYLPKISEATCLKSNALFFSRFLTDTKFCAGYKNGTSVCNGDSGGGFMIFVPDVSGDASPNATGSWHVRGLVSMSLSRRDEAICDPNQYSLFTDVAKYKGWINRHMQ